jgi:hypothetical protein
MQEKMSKKEIINLKLGKKYVDKKDYFLFISFFSLIFGCGN